MRHDDINEEMSFAAYKLSRAQEALSDQIAIVFRLKALGLNADLAGRDLDKVSDEFRRWREYRALLMIRRGMAREALAAAQGTAIKSTRYASIDYRRERERI